MKRLILNFSKITDANLGAKAQAILTAMTANTNFPTPFPALDDVDDSIDAYLAALLAAETRDKIKVAFKNSARQSLVDTLTSLGNYVMSVAKGDEAKLVSSGFSLTKQREPQPPITSPQNFIVGSGLNKGEITTAVDKVTGARSYLHEYTEDPITANSVWTSITATSRKHLFTDLASGHNLWFRVAAIGTKGQIVYTAIQSRVVL